MNSTDLRELKSAVRLIHERVEDYKANVADLYIDTNLASIMSNTRNQILYGRRGLGKTHLLMKLYNYYLEKLESDRMLPIYINAQTIAQRASIFKDETNYCRVAYKKLLNAIFEVMEKFMKEENRLNRFEKILPRGQKREKVRKVSNLIVQIREHIQRGVRETETGNWESSENDLQSDSSTSESGLDFNVDLNKNKADFGLAAHAKESRRSNRKTEETMEIIYKGIIGYDLNEVGVKLDKIIKILKLEGMVILLDEWSKFNRDNQAYLAEMIKSTIISGRCIHVKIACIPTETILTKQKSNGQLIGYPIGEEIFPDVDLDQIYTSFVKPEDPITNFLLMVLQKHLSVSINTLKTKSFVDVFKNELFQDEEVIEELITVSCGIPRDFLRIFRTAFIKSEDSLPITSQNVRSAAFEIFNSEKSKLIQDNDKKSSALFESIYDYLTSSYLFFVSKKYSDNQLLKNMWNGRIIHLVYQNANAFSNGKRGTYDIYKIDPGKYIDLRSFEKGEENYKKMDEFATKIKAALKIAPALDKLWSPRIDKGWRANFIGILSKVASSHVQIPATEIAKVRNDVTPLVVDQLISDAISSP